MGARAEEAEGAGHRRADTRRWLPRRRRLQRLPGISGAILDIADRMSDEVDVIVSGHTHRAYNCMIDKKLVTSAAAFGRLITAIDLTNRQAQRRGRLKNRAQRRRHPRRAEGSGADRHHRALPSFLRDGRKQGCRYDRARRDAHAESRRRVGSGRHHRRRRARGGRGRITGRRRGVHEPRRHSRRFVPQRRKRASTRSLTPKRRACCHFETGSSCRR